QGTGDCNLSQGPGGSVKHLGCAIFSENPSDGAVAVWGRWAHEIGHAFQQGGPAHPSNYNNSFELMDRSYPGQTGVFEKQSDQGLLIEQVLVGGDPVVTVKGPGGDGNKLWKATSPNLDTIFVENGVTIQIDKKGLETAPDDWRINVRYDTTPQPDVMISPWRS